MPRAVTIERSGVGVRRVVGLLACFLAIAVAGSAAAEARTYQPDCRYHLRYQPRSIVVFCADANMSVKRIHWYGWGRRQARGRSRRAYANDCIPNCAVGHFHRYRVRLVLSRARTCPDNGKRFFSRMTVIFVGRKWAGPRQFTQPTPCRPLS
jgi:hypothetical protein